jgi:catechol 2,3-dioxygenase-like lactoylglutathione lyase family enzyme
MAVELNHTIIWTRDKLTSAEFLASILDLPVGALWGPFVPIQLDNGVTLDYADANADDIRPQHYAFLVDDATFDAALARIKHAEVDYWADPFHRQPGAINYDHGGRGLYFADPDGHNMELQTTPYSDPPPLP